MTERYAQMTERIRGLRQLWAVVNAMRGIAGARAAQARGGVGAVDGYSAIIARAIGEVLCEMPEADEPKPGPQHTATVAFGAEQGFVGGFAEHMIEALVGESEPETVFLVGTRAGALAAERGLVPVWQAAMPSHPSGVPRLANRIADALFERINEGTIACLDVMWSDGGPEGPRHAIVRRRLFPLEHGEFAGGAGPPLRHLDAESLLQDLTEDYVHAQLCRAALHAFAAENEARVEAMATARRQIDRRLDALLATRRQMRQEEITAEIVELASGEGAARAADRTGKKPPA